MAKKRQGPRGDLTGRRFGRLVAVRKHHKDSRQYWHWECLCDCGETVVVNNRNLRDEGAGTRSCGCWRRERAAELAKTPWNRGLTYTIPGRDGKERVYKQKHSWALAVLRERGNRCEACGWDEARCDVHHRAAKSKGGQNTLSNAVVLCPNCHRKHHEGKLTWQPSNTSPSSAASAHARSRRKDSDGSR
jgi:hypothetical protein